MAYELSVDQDSADSWHAAVSANALNGPNWEFLMAFLKPGDVFFDLGANIGTMSIPAAVAGARVTAFESSLAVISRISNGPLFATTSRTSQ